jgi:hypothetical protein
VGLGSISTDGHGKRHSVDGRTRTTTIAPAAAGMGPTKLAKALSGYPSLNRCVSEVSPVRRKTSRPPGFRSPRDVRGGTLARKPSAVAREPLEGAGLFH